LPICSWEGMVPKRKLIWVPQFPAKLRYQEWWFYYIPKIIREKYNHLFDEVIILGESYIKYSYSPKHEKLSQDKNFTNRELAIHLELIQIDEYLKLDINQDDIVLIGDISYPGLFCNILFTKKPCKCFAICHASAKNRYDIWEYVREQKILQELAIADLMNGIFVATEYHYMKLKWYGAHIVGLPFLYKYDQNTTHDFYGIPLYNKEKFELPIVNKKPHFKIASASRICQQKVDMTIEQKVEQAYNLKIKRLADNKNQTWLSYYANLANSKILLITSHEETFGYQVADCVLGTSNCVPLAPRQNSYPELLSDDYLYDRNDINELFHKIDLVFTGKLKKPDKLLNQDLVDNFFDNIVKIMVR